MAVVATIKYVLAQFQFQLSPLHLWYPSIAPPPIVAYGQKREPTTAGSVGNFLTAAIFLAGIGELNSIVLEGLLTTAIAIQVRRRW